MQSIVNMNGNFSRTQVNIFSDELRWGDSAAHSIQLTYEGGRAIGINLSGILLNDWHHFPTLYPQRKQGGRM